ncbi:MAG TPA: hypothetical protein VFF30_16080 [Nitrososphaerales archaeon]|nr:hypothetical protein [Nitrososphaerales archaeon]
MLFEFYRVLIIENPSAEISAMSTSETLPKWVAEEIRNAKFTQEEDWEGSGYILDVNKSESKIDVQFYEKLPEGRYIATLELPNSYNIDSLELAVVYMFKFKALRAPLPEKVVSFLKEKFGLNMDSIYRFELKSTEKLEDVSADNPPPPPLEQEDEEGDKSPLN